MQNIDWIILMLYFVLLITIGIWASRKVKESKDFYTAGGKLPWWLSGISHHVSSHSGAIFVAYGAVAYTHGFTLYMWWAFPSAIALIIGSYFIAPRWSRLREALGVQSPTEYLSKRYNIATQQVIAWSGVLIKIFDIGAKWASIALILYVFTGTPIITGILLAGGVSLIYNTLGGLWADVWNDLVQFGIQVAGGITMLCIAVTKLGGISAAWTMWDRLPENNSHLVNDPYTVWFLLGYFFICFFSSNGGTWNLATRFISSSSGSEAKRAARLSAILYLIWPLIIFFPLWAGPLLMPGVKPEEAYSQMAVSFLPTGLLGLVLASLFANTLTMTSSDANTISSVITRDIFPVLFKKVKDLSAKKFLMLARFTTFVFTLFTIIIAIYADSFSEGAGFSGILALLVTWFAALVGPTAIPMLLGLLPAFKRSGSSAAIISIIGGFVTFIVTKVLMIYDYPVSKALQVAAPMIVSFILYVLIGFINKKKPVSEEIEIMLKSLNHDSVRSKSK